MTDIRITHFLLLIVLSELCAIQGRESLQLSCIIAAFLLAIICLINDCMDWRLKRLEKKHAELLAEMAAKRT